jgi:predicted regulator of Ras-like GTPase activity (Roadblock/LC7/MglB family)
MESKDSSSPESGDYPAALPLEISQVVASRADDLLREFAEDSGLETALIVDRSGALVAGISAEAEVTVEVISALVAGASGAMRALVSQLGETGAMESLHLGGDRMIYLREIVNGFILVGVSDATRPAGLVRSKAHAIEGELTKLLHDIRPAGVPLPPPTLAGSSSGSLPEVAMSRDAQGLAPLGEEAETELGVGPDPKIPRVESLPFANEKEEEELEIEPIFESDPDPDPEDIVRATPVEPREILEPLDFGEAEIVIEPAIPMIPPFTKRHLPVDSPFEVEMAESNKDVEEEITAVPAVTLLSESIFELESSNDEEEFELSVPKPPASFFEFPVDDEEELTDETGQAGDNFFEADDDDDTDENGHESEDIAKEIREMIDEEEEESEVRSSGPFYF